MLVVYVIALFHDLFYHKYPEFLERNQTMIDDFLYLHFPDYALMMQLVINSMSWSKVTKKGIPLDIVNDSIWSDIFLALTNADWILAVDWIGARTL
jgi:hypothetical protein